MAVDTSSNDFTTLALSAPAEGVVHVSLNRPKKLNAMNRAFWPEVTRCFKMLSADPECRAIVLSANGRIFTAGLDLTDMPRPKQGDDTARTAYYMHGHLLHLQESFNAIESCAKPVVACVHSACVGGGIDMIAACDVRLCTADAWFCVKEAEIGIAADLGTLQRLPKCIGSASVVRELALTARKMLAEEALRVGLVSAVSESRDAMLRDGIAMAARMASLSPIAVQVTKRQLNYARDHTVQDGLDYIASWNMAMLQADDVGAAAMASMQKTKATFSKL